MVNKCGIHFSFSWETSPTISSISETHSKTYSNEVRDLLNIPLGMRYTYALD